MTLKNAIRKAYHDENLELVSGCANKLRFGLGLAVGSAANPPG